MHAYEWSSLLQQKAVYVSSSQEFRKSSTGARFLTFDHAYGYFIHESTNIHMHAAPPMHAQRVTHTSHICIPSNIIQGPLYMWPLEKQMYLYTSTRSNKTHRRTASQATQAHAYTHNSTDAHTHTHEWFSLTTYMCLLCISQIGPKATS
jgi:hypothetical protein